MTMNKPELEATQAGNALVEDTVHYAIKAAYRAGAEDMLQTWAEVCECAPLPQHADIGETSHTYWNDNRKTILAALRQPVDATDAEGVENARERAAREVEGDCDNPIRVREANGIREGVLDSHPAVVRAEIVPESADKTPRRNASPFPPKAETVGEGAEVRARMLAARMLAARIMAAVRNARFPKEYPAEAHDEFESLTLTPMLQEALRTPSPEKAEIERAIERTFNAMNNSLPAQGESWNTCFKRRLTDELCAALASTDDGEEGA